jgi:hypothetical protein
VSPDATRYCAWDRSEAASDAAQLADYARTTAKNIRQMNRDYPGEYDREVAWLPLLDALHAELATGEQMSASEAAVILAAAETAYARAL